MKISRGFGRDSNIDVFYVVSWRRHTRCQLLAQVSTLRRLANLRCRGPETPGICRNRFPQGIDAFFLCHLFVWSLSCGLKFFLLKTKSRKDLSCFSLVKSLGKQPKKTTWDASPHPVRSSSFIGIPWPEVERCASEGVREGSSSRFFDGVAGTTVVTIEKSMVFF